MCSHLHREFSAAARLASSPDPAAPEVRVDGEIPSRRWMGIHRTGHGVRSKGIMVPATTNDSLRLEPERDAGRVGKDASTG